MKYLDIIAICSCLALSAFAAQADDEALPGPIPARIVKVVDGDTVLVRARIWLDQDVETNVRLRGVDTPERHGKCQDERDAAQTALDFTSQRLSHDQVTLHDVTHDKYGKRVIARIVTAEGEDLSAALIKAGLGREYYGGRKIEWCRG
jgi:micrococcal nuclease